MDEVKAYSGIYLVSVAKKRPKVNKGKKVKKTDESDKMAEQPAEKRKNTGEKKKTGFIFPYRSKKVLFRAANLQEAVRLGDFLVEKMIDRKSMLTS